MTVDETPPGPLARVVFFPRPEHGLPPEVVSATAYRPPDSFSAEVLPSTVFLSDQSGLGVYAVGARGRALLVGLPPDEHSDILTTYRADRLPTQLHAPNAAGDLLGWQIHHVATTKTASELRDAQPNSGAVSSAAAAQVATGLSRLTVWSPASRAVWAAICLSLDRPWISCRAVDLTRRGRWAETWFGVDSDSFTAAFMERAGRRSDGSAPLLAYQVDATALAEEVGAVEPTRVPIKPVLQEPIETAVGMGPQSGLHFSTPLHFELYVQPGQFTAEEEHIFRIHFGGGYRNPLEKEAMIGPCGYSIENSVIEDWDTVRFFTSGVRFGLLWAEGDDGESMLLRFGSLTYKRIVDEFRRTALLDREPIRVSTVDSHGRPFQGTIRAFSDMERPNLSDFHPSPHRTIFAGWGSHWGRVKVSDLEFDAIQEAIQTALAENGLRDVSSVPADAPELESAALRVLELLGREGTAPSVTDEPKSHPLPAAPRGRTSSPTAITSTMVENGLRDVSSPPDTLELKSLALAALELLRREETARLVAAPAVKPHPLSAESKDWTPTRAVISSLFGVSLGYLGFQIGAAVGALAAIVALRVGVQLPEIPVVWQLPLEIVVVVAAGVFGGVRRLLFSARRSSTGNSVEGSDPGRDGDLSEGDRMRAAAAFFCSDQPWANERVPDFTQRVELARRWFRIEMHDPEGRFDPTRFLEHCFDYEIRRTNDQKPLLAYVRGFDSASGDYNGRCDDPALQPA